MQWRSTWVAVGSIASWLCLGACSESDGARCGSGTELIAGECLPVSDAGAKDAGGDNDSGAEMTATTTSCGDRSFLVDGQCRGVQPVGGSCEHGKECDTGTCFPEDDGFTGGYCSVLDCNDLRACGPGSHCVFSAKKKHSICMAFCSGSSECRDGYVCQPIYGTQIGVCSPSCVGAEDICPDQTQCDAESGKCVLRECDPNQSSSDCGDDRICYPDTRKLTTQGGLCLSKCDPSAPSCHSGDVCQPLPEDPQHQGICAPPVCKETSDCSVGAVCRDSVCQPPARCDDHGACSDDATACVGGPGGQCMPKCSDDAACTDIHAGLTCATGVASDKVCLPIGSFPGSACRADKNSACDSVAVGSSHAAMSCEDNKCLVECATGGEAVCQKLSADLHCATGIYAEPVCLPTGSYPGAPCAGADHDQCADVKLAQGVNAKQTCAGGRCVFDCSAAADGGEAYCAGIDTSLSCASAAFPGKSVCLPTGSYPGGACAHGTCGKLGDRAMACENDVCLVTCTPDDPATSQNEDACGAVDASLVCAHGVYASDVCLPKGSFPGSACGGAAHDQCAQNLNGVSELDMQCVRGTCVIGCSETGKYAGYGEALCGFADPSLTCSQASGSICVKACNNGSCGAGFSCLDPGAAPAHENSCLPNGSFLGAACATGNVCAGQPMLTCVPAAKPVCAAGCSVANGAAAANQYCTQVGTSTGAGFNTCSDVGGGLHICTKQ